MTFDEMNTRAANRETVPHDLTPSERIAFMALRLLYELHGLGVVSRSDGVRLKAGIEKELVEMRTQEAKYAASETAIKYLRQSDNPEIRHALSWICGRGDLSREEFEQWYKRRKEIDG